MLNRIQCHPVRPLGVVHRIRVQSNYNIAVCPDLEDDIQQGDEQSIGNQTGQK